MGVCPNVYFCSYVPYCACPSAVSWLCHWITSESTTCWFIPWDTSFGPRRSTPNLSHHQKYFQSSWDTGCQHHHDTTGSRQSILTGSINNTMRTTAQPITPPPNSPPLPPTTSLTQDRRPSLPLLPPKSLCVRRRHRLHSYISLTSTNGNRMCTVALMLLHQTPQLQTDPQTITKLSLGELTTSGNSLSESLNWLTAVGEI